MNGLAVRLRRTGAFPDVKLDAPATVSIGHLVLAWDGRIDNREELGERLHIRARELAALSDGALLIAGYERFGIECLAHVVGDYACALWDGRAGSLTCARDPLGQRPFFYHLARSTFVAGTSVAGVLAHPEVPRRPNEGVVAEYLAGALTSRDETLFDSVCRLEPGTWLRIENDGERRGRIEWVDPGARVRYAREEQYAEHLGELLRTAVRARLRGAERVGIELSGGLDSATIAGIAREELGDAAPDRACLLSLVFPGLPCDERPLIEACQRAWKLPAHLVPAGGHDAADASRDIDHLDFPYHPNGTMSVRLRRRARADGTRVILTGIGGDEWFSGSRFHVADDLRRGNLAAAIRQACLDADLEPGTRPGATFFHYGLWPAVPVGLKRVARRFRGAPTMKAPWITPALMTRSDLAGRVRLQPSAPEFPTAAQTDMFRSALSAWSVHGTEMEARLAADLDIELRHPLADLRVARFGLAIPEEQRWAGRERKRVLRAAAAGRVPEIVRARRSKVDFSPVVVQALEAQGGPAFFRSLGVQAVGWVDAEPLDRMYAGMRERYAAGDPGYMALAWTLWMIAGVERWARAAGFVAAPAVDVRATA